jgi:hypothetical protein
MLKGRKVKSKLERVLALLEEWNEMHDTPCRFDHHGYCQEHYLEDDCIVARTKKELENA